MELDKKSFKKMFPNLAEELDDPESRIAVNSVRSDSQTGEEAASRKFADYVPDVIDFIRRCDTFEQAEEIVAYLEKRGEIDKEYAERLRTQLKDKGLRSFGQKKEESYYLKHGDQ